MDVIQRSNAPITPPPVNDSEIQDRSLLTPDTVRRMKFTELRDALKERGMSIKGLKVDLVSRLHQGMEG